MAQGQKHIDVGWRQLNRFDVESHFDDVLGTLIVHALRDEGFVKVKSFLSHLFGDV